MRDLLSSLVLPNSSQESFHSISSQPRADSPPPSALKTAPIAPTAPEIQTSAFQAAGLPVYDVDIFLKENKPLHSNSASNNKYPAKNYSQSAASPAEPVSLGTKTSFHVAALNMQCQLKGFLPIFEIEGDASNADFGGLLKLRDMTITSDQRWHSKKEAREGLAEKGLESVQGMEAKRKEIGTPSEPGTNWVGILHGKQAENDICPGSKKSDKLTPLCYRYRIPLPSPRPNLQRVRSRPRIRLHRHHPFSTRPALRFHDQRLPLQEGSPH